MKLAIMQPYIFPYLGYFQLINAVDKYILYDRVNFIKKSWINQNYILNAGKGEPQQFSIPLLSISSNKLIKEIKILNGRNWRKKLLHTVFYNYKKAKFFDEVYNLLLCIIKADFEYLYEFNNQSIKKIAEYLDIKTQISTDEPYFNELEAHLAQRENYYQSYDEDIYQNRVLRILEICHKEEANTYYNSIGGQQLYDKALFHNHNIELGFIKQRPIFYKQFRNGFIPNLSVIDVMMFNSKEKIFQMLNEYDIV